MRRSADHDPEDDSDERPAPRDAKTTKARWRPGSRLAGKADPVAVAEALNAFREENGKVDVYRVIEAAKRPSSPFHPCFTWDVKKGMRELWVDQAQRLIREVEYVISEDPNAQHMRFINCEVQIGEDDTARAYYREDDIAETDELADFALREATRAMLGWCERYKRISRLAKARARIEATVEYIRKLMAADAA